MNDSNPGDIQDIQGLLREARNVAVVGLSDDPSRPSYDVARALQGHGFRIFPVNPNLEGPVLGEHPYASLREIEARVDIVDVFRNSEKVMPVAEEAVAAGAGMLWLQLGVTNEEAASYAEDHGLAVVSNRCLKVDYGRLIGT
jgi:predicted CoA-binding protein